MRSRRSLGILLLVLLAVSTACRTGRMVSLQTQPGATAPRGLKSGDRVRVHLHDGQPTGLRLRPRFCRWGRVRAAAGACTCARHLAGGATFNQQAPNVDSHRLLCVRGVDIRRPWRERVPLRGVAHARLRWRQRRPARPRPSRVSEAGSGMGSDSGGAVMTWPFSSVKVNPCGSSSGCLHPPKARLRSDAVGAVRAARRSGGAAGGAGSLHAARRGPAAGERCASAR